MFMFIYYGFTVDEDYDVAALINALTILIGIT
jgi:hypothetical protein